MIGSIDTRKRKVLVIGGGISGLLAAYSLDSQGFEVTLLESQSRVGGLIQTQQFPQGIAESAAHSFLATEAVQKVCADLGVELLRVHPESKARYILRNGQMKRFPLTLLEALGLLLKVSTVRGKLNSDSSHSLSVQEWAEAHLGKAATRYLMAPMVRGVYGTDLCKISMAAAFPNWVVSSGKTLLSERLLKSRSRTAQRASMVAPKGGMESVIRALEARLRERLKDRFKLGCLVRDLPEAENLLLCVPADVASKILTKVHPQLSQALARVSYTALTCVTVFIKKCDLKTVPQGVGVLVPPGERRQCLGILFNSSSFSERVSHPDEWISLSVMMPGSQSLEQVQNTVRKDLEALFGLSGHSEVYTARNWENAIPCYNADLIQAWTVARETWCATPGRALFGNYTGQVSLRGLVETAMALGKGREHGYLEKK